MENVDGLYTDFHKKRLGEHCYPSEWLIRTMLGTYPKLEFPHNYEGKRVLDWSCGDGRNLPLLFNCGFDVYATEITQEIVDGVSERMHRFGLKPDIRVGRNNSQPFADEFFDYIVASMSIYYVDHDSDFSCNHAELSRLLKKGGRAIITLAHPETYVLEGSVDLGNGNYRITSDPHGLRNGDIFRAFSNEDEIRDEFAGDFDHICIGSQNENYYGYNIKVWMVVMKKR